MHDNQNSLVVSHHRHRKHHKREIRMTPVIITAASLGLLAGLIVTLNGSVPGILDDEADTGTLLTSSGSSVPLGLTGPAAQAKFWGVDVSNYQPTVNWEQLYTEGARFALVEEGGESPANGLWRDSSTYAEDMAGAAGAHLYGIPYFYVDPAPVKGNAVDEAQIAVQQMGHESSPLALDFEAPDAAPYCYGKNSSDMVRWIRTFANEVQKLTGQPPIIYTGPDWWRSCVASSPASIASSTASFGHDQLWISNYRKHAPPEMPPGVAATWGIWQWDDKAVVPGITGDVDIDVFNPQTVLLTDPLSQRSKVGASVHLKLNSLNALAGYRLTYSAKNLPSGLQISKGVITGTITGAPRVNDPYQVAITATNPYGGTDTVEFSWTVAPGKPQPKTTPSPTPSPSTPTATPSPTGSTSPSPSSTPAATPSPTGSTPGTSPSPTSTQPVTVPPTTTPTTSSPATAPPGL
jgi:GH25 family lysozyme M1 (1,4-beta-N-acetylmuramidase)